MVPEVQQKLCQTNINFLSSFKWFSKHVVGHCDLKPFKCVIFGCDMTFSTQNGLARHVPTHFNESRVRRACVITNEAAKQANLTSPSSSSNIACSTSIDGDNQQEDPEEKTKESKLKQFIDHSTSFSSKHLL